MCSRISEPEVPKVFRNNYKLELKLGYELRFLYFIFSWRIIFCMNNNFGCQEICLTYAIYPSSIKYVVELWAIYNITVNISTPESNTPTYTSKTLSYYNIPITIKILVLGIYLSNPYGQTFIRFLFSKFCTEIKKNSDLLCLGSGPTLFWGEIQSIESTLVILSFSF